MSDPIEKNDLTAQDQDDTVTDETPETEPLTIDAQTGAGDDDLVIDTETVATGDDVVVEAVPAVAARTRGSREVRQPRAPRGPVQYAVIKTGTDNSAMEVDYEALAAPAVMRRRRDNTVEALKQSGVELLDIPAFLRKQAD